MYCVRCGVRLEDGVKSCPLCGTPVWDPEAPSPEADRHYNARLYPVRSRSTRYAALAFVTVLLCTACLACLIVCLRLYGAVAWSGYAMLGAALAYIGLVLPLWFRRYRPAVFLPVSFAAAGGYLLYICLRTGGRWFLPFAFPCTGIAFLCTFGGWGLALFKGKSKLLLTGVYIMLLGGATMLIEFFQHIAFLTPMFRWSLYSASSFGLIGLFLFVSSFIPPLRRALHRKLFL